MIMEQNHLMSVPELAWKWSGEPGQDLHDALRWACKRFKPRRYLEIGVDGGGSLETVLSVHHPKMIVLVDLFDGQHAGHGFLDFNHIPPLIKKHRYIGEFWTIQGDSTVEVPKLTEFFDLILVDGDHSYETCLADLNNTLPLMANGGLMIIDDIGHEVYPGVLKAAIEFVEGKHNKLLLIEEEGMPWRNCAILQRMP